MKTVKATKKTSPPKRTLRTIRAEMRLHIKQLVETRDALRELEAEVQGLADCAQNAAECLTQSVELLSELV